MKMKKRNYPQAYLEECKHKVKKIRRSKFINTELQSDSESELEFDTGLESKLESNSKQFSSDGPFVNFKQAKKLLVISLTLNRPKNY